MILFRKARRRHPGVYVFLTRRHLRRGVEVGYVGKSNHLELRKAQHADKPWADLVVGYRALRLPWWLGWQPITLTLETLVILALRPRYNWQKNPRPGKVGPREQITQRAARDRMRPVQPAGPIIDGVPRVSFLVSGLGVAMIVIGILGTWITKG